MGLMSAKLGRTEIAELEAEIERLRAALTEIEVGSRTGMAPHHMGFLARQALAGE